MEFIKVENHIKFDCVRRKKLAVWAVERWSRWRACGHVKKICPCRKSSAVSDVESDACRTARNTNQRYVSIDVDAEKDGQRLKFGERPTHELHYAHPCGTDNCGEEMMEWQVDDPCKGM